MADETAPCQFRPAQSKPVIGWAAIGHAAGSGECREQARMAIAARKQMLQPHGKAVAAPRQAAGSGDMQTSSAELPHFTILEVARHQTGNRIVPHLRCLEENTERTGNLILDKGVEGLSLAFKSRLDQTIAAIGVGDVRAGIEVQPCQ